jgi:membrane protein YdbS with pleckstrin-like domain
MNFLRRTALSLAEITDRFASSGQKEWARAILHELEFIESDWTALRWAASGCQILFKPYKAHIPLRSLLELPALTEKLEALLKKRARIVLGIFAIQTIWFAYFAQFLKPWPIMRLGCALIYASVIFVTAQAILCRVRAKPPVHEVLALREWYGSELRRQHEFHSRGWMWRRVFSLVPGPLLFCFGFWLFHPTPSYALTSFSILAAFFILGRIGIANQQRRAALYQTRIKELDVLARYTQ